MTGDGVLTAQGLSQEPSDVPVEERLADLWRAQARSAATSESAYKALREAILQQVLVPGARLAEEEVARNFGISRTPIREAILRLEAEGLAERVSGRTALVTEIRPQEIVEIYEVRSAIDGLAAELAAARIAPPALSSLEWTNEEMRAAGGSGDFTRMAALNLQFHEELAKASGNGFLLRQLVAVHDRVRRFPGTTFAHGTRWQSAVSEHEEILGALRAQDAARAGDLARAHMNAARDVRIALLYQRHGVVPGDVPASRA